MVVFARRPFIDRTATDIGMDIVAMAIAAITVPAAMVTCTEVMDIVAVIAVGRCSATSEARRRDPAGLSQGSSHIRTSSRSTRGAKAACCRSDKIDQAAVRTGAARIDVPSVAVADGGVAVECLIALPMGFGDRAAAGLMIHAVAVAQDAIDGPAQAGFTVHVGLAAGVLGAFVFTNIILTHQRKPSPSCWDSRTAAPKL